MLNSLYPTTHTLLSRFIAASITNTGQIPHIHTYVANYEFYFSPPFPSHVRRLRGRRGLRPNG